MSNAFKLTRRKFLHTGAIGAAGIGLLGADGFVESNHLHLVKIEIPLARLPRSFDGFTIVQLSDFHYDERFSAVPIAKSVDMVNQLKPDMIALTGDFVTVPTFQTSRFLRNSALTARPCAEILGRLQGPKYAIFGNHDAMSNPPLISDVLEAKGISVLRNRSVSIERGNDRMWLAGIDDLLRGMPDIHRTLRGIPPDEATIFLAHEPDYARDAAHHPIDLQLSGHSHGGQIWIPGIGAPWLPPLARKYPRGLYHIGDLTLYTNIGIGTIRAPVRINCIPEVTLITLRSRSGDQERAKQAV